MYVVVGGFRRVSCRYTWWFSHKGIFRTQSILIQFTMTKTNYLKKKKKKTTKNNYVNNIPWHNKNKIEIHKISHSLFFSSSLIFFFSFFFGYYLFLPTNLLCKQRNFCARWWLYRRLASSPRHPCQCRACATQTLRRWGSQFFSSRSTSCARHRVATLAKRKLGRPRLI